MLANFVRHHLQEKTHLIAFGLLQQQVQRLAREPGKDFILYGSLEGKSFRKGFAEEDRQLRFKDIYYIEATENKTFIYCKDDFYESKLKLYEIEEMVKELSFFRCSKSIILNYSKIDCVTPAFNGRFEAKLFNGERVIISRQYVPILKEILGI